MLSAMSLCQPRSRSGRKPGLESDRNRDRDSLKSDSRFGRIEAVPVSRFPRRTIRSYSWRSRARQMCCARETAISSMSAWLRAAACMACASWMTWPFSRSCASRGARQGRVPPVGTGRSYVVAAVDHGRVCSRPGVSCATPSQAPSSRGPSARSSSCD